MEYPGALFTRPLRRLTLILFIGAFVIITPLIILYTAGYRYDWQNGFLRETGSISIDIAPKNASVYLNGIKLKDETPLFGKTLRVRLSSITPRLYTVLISAPGYYDWQKDVEVKNRQTVYIKEINLIKKSKPALISNIKVNQLALSTDGQYLLAQTEPSSSQTSLLLLNTETNITTTILTMNHKENFTIQWAPIAKNNYFFITNARAPYNFVTVINADHPETKIDLVERTRKPLTKVQWKESGEPTLYYSTPTSISSFTLSTAQESTIVTNTFLDWSVENDQLWTIQENTSAQTITIIKDTLGFPTNFATISPTTLPIAVSSTTVTFLAVRRNIVILKNKEENTHVLVVSPNQKFIVNGTKFFASPYNHWWLFWTTAELWNYNEENEPTLLVRSGKSLEHVVALDEYNTLAVASDKETQAFFPYYLIQQELFNKPARSIAANIQKRLLYFADKEGIWQLAY